MPEIAQMVVRFERDRPPCRYPYLGQACLMGVVDQYLKGSPCKRPVEFCALHASPEAQIQLDRILDGTGRAVERLSAFAAWTPPPAWFMPEDGWKTARCLQAALASRGAGDVGIVEILGGLIAEADDMGEVMEAAFREDIRFQIDVEECAHPPVDLVAWVERDFAETATIIRQVLETNGIEITEQRREETK